MSTLTMVMTNGKVIKYEVKPGEEEGVVEDLKSDPDHKYIHHEYEDGNMVWVNMDAISTIYLTKKEESE